MIFRVLSTAAALSLVFVWGCADIGAGKPRVILLDPPGPEIECEGCVSMAFDTRVGAASFPILQDIGGKEYIVDFDSRKCKIDGGFPTLLAGENVVWATGPGIEYRIRGHTVAHMEFMDRMYPVLRASHISNTIVQPGQAEQKPSEEDSGVKRVKIDAPQSATLSGTIRALRDETESAEYPVIRIDIKAPDIKGRITLTCNKETEILKQGRPITLADLAVGQEVDVEYESVSYIRIVNVPQGKETALVAKRVTITAVAREGRAPPRAATRPSESAARAVTGDGRAEARSKEQDDWDQARTKGTIEAYIEFAAKHPESRYLELVEGTVSEVEGMFLDGSGLAAYTGLRLREEPDRTFFLNIHDANRVTTGMRVRLRVTKHTSPPLIARLEVLEPAPADKDVGFALLLGAVRGDLDAVKALVERGANPNACDKNGLTTLMFGAWSGRLDVVAFLVECGAEVNAATPDGRTALLYAAAQGHLEVVKYLVQKGAEVDAVATQPGITPTAPMTQTTPIMCAKASGHSDVASYLAAQGARDVDIRGVIVVCPAVVMPQK